MAETDLVSILRRHDADAATRAAAAWNRCNRADELLEAAALVGVSRPLVVAAACDCARRALACHPGMERGPRRALDAADAWMEHRATTDEVRRRAQDAASVLDTESCATRADHAAWAALWACAVVYAKTDDDAAAAADACGYAAAQATRAFSFSRVVRNRIPWQVVAAAAGLPTRVAA